MHSAIDITGANAPAIGNAVVMSTTTTTTTTRLAVEADSSAREALTTFNKKTKAKIRMTKQIQLSKIEIQTVTTRYAASLAVEAGPPCSPRFGEAG